MISLTSKKLFIQDEQETPPTCFCSKKPGITLPADTFSWDVFS